MNAHEKAVAAERIAARKKAAERGYEQRLAELRETEPALAETERLLAALGAKIAMTAMSGNADAVTALRERALPLEQKKQSILKKHGLADGPAYSCPLCRDTGFVDGNPCGCLETTARAVLLEELFGDICDMPTMDGFDLSYYPDEPDKEGRVPRKIMASTLRIAKEFIETFPDRRNLLFIGGCGLGKTHLSLALAAEIALRGYRVVYGSAQNILTRAVRESMDWNGDGDYVDRLLSCDLLVMDDLGTEFSTQPGNAMLFQLIDARLQSGRSTVINTNLGYEELERRYEPRIVSRFTGQYIRRGFLGNDIRQLKKDK